MENLKVTKSSRPSNPSRVLIHPKCMNKLRVGAAEAIWIFNSGKLAAIGIAWPSIATPLDSVDIGSYLSSIISEDGIKEVEVCRVNEALMEAQSVVLHSTVQISDTLKSNHLFMAHIRNYLQSVKYLKISQEIEVSFAGTNYQFAAESKPSTTPVFPRNFLLNLSEVHQADEVSTQACVIVKTTEIRFAGSPLKLSSNIIAFSDIGGLKEQIRIVRETIETPLHTPEIYTQFGMKPPKGILLYGPPGTGKTLIARAVAGQTKAHFCLINGAELMSRFVGETETKLREVFIEARSHSPAIVFIDEMDSLCPKREEAANETEKRIVATLLTLLDGIEFDSDSDNSNKNIVVLGATNRPNAIDPALRRPGRFDREVEIGVPNPLERLEILQVHLRNVPQDVSEEDLKHLASTTHGYVGADLAALTREAGMIAIKRWKESKEATNDVSNALSNLILSGDPSSSKPPSTSSPCLTFSDLVAAKTIIRPSAMREITLEIPETKWEDIGGMKEQKQVLQESILYPLKYPQTFHRLNLAPPKGILLYGPPGCSKTLLAKALATEAEHNFFLVKAGEIFNPYVGESERLVREVFRKAKSNAPSIIFFDEIDALALKRSGSDGSSKVGDRVLTTLLAEMDGVETLQHVFVVAATNRPDVLDSALMRPGRFDRLLYVSPPDTEARREIMMIQAKKMKIEADLEDIVRRTYGFTGAEIVGLCREAALAAIRADPENASSITKENFETAFKSMKPRLTPESIEYYKEFARQSE